MTSRIQRKLIPDTAIGRATTRVQAAQAAAVEAAANADAATRRLRVARDARQAAPAFDAEAASAAIRAGDEPPTATLPQREADERAAEEVVRVLADCSREAVSALHRAIHDDRRALIDAQAAAVAASRDSALELLDEAAAVIDVLLTERSALGAYLVADEYRIVRGERRTRSIGTLRFDVPGAIDSELRAAISTARRLLAAVEATTTTAADYDDAQTRKRERRAGPTARSGALVWSGT